MHDTVPRVSTTARQILEWMRRGRPPNFAGPTRVSTTARTIVGGREGMGRVRWDKYLFYPTLAVHCVGGAATGARCAEPTGLYSKRSQIRCNESSAPDSRRNRKATRFISNCGGEVCTPRGGLPPLRVPRPDVGPQTCHKLRCKARSCPRRPPHRIHRPVQQTLRKQTQLNADDISILKPTAPVHWRGRPQ